MKVSFEKSSFPSLNKSRLHLNSSICEATETASHIYLVTYLNDCGTTYVETGEAFVFSNVVLQDAVPLQGAVITREHDYEFPFQCTYSRKKLLSLEFVPEGRKDIPDVGMCMKGLTLLMSLGSETQILNTCTNL